MYESFYGGKQGRSYQIVQHFDSIYDMFTNFSQGNTYTDVAFDEYVIIDTILNRNQKNNPENGIIYRRGYNFNENFSKIPSTITNNDLTNTISQEMVTSVTLVGDLEESYSFVWGPDGTNQNSISGDITRTVTVPAFYNFEYKLLDDGITTIEKGSFNQDRWSTVWNSFVTQPGGGAIYIGQIVGAQGGSSAIELIDWSTYKTRTENNSESIQGSFNIIPKKGYDSTYDSTDVEYDINGYDEDGYDRNGFHDTIQYGYCTVRDAQGNISGVYLAFDFPYTVFNFHADGISAYPRNVSATSYTDPDTGITYTYNSTTRKWNYQNLISEYGDSEEHPYYKHYNIKIPAGIHGQDIPGLAILNKTGNNYNDVYDENGDYITEVIEGQDSSGNKILNPDFANQFLTYQTRNYDQFNIGEVSDPIPVSPYRIITSIENTTKINPPAASQNNSNYQHNYPKELVWHYTYGNDTTVDYSVIERVWVQNGDSPNDKIYGSTTEGLKDGHLYVLYSTEDKPRDLGLIKFVTNVWTQTTTDNTQTDSDGNYLTENCVYIQLTGEDHPRYLGLIKRVDDIWIQADNDSAHPSNKIINANNDTVKQDYIYTQLTNEEYPHELGFIRKITSIERDASNNETYINYNYNTLGGPNERERLPISEIKKVAFDGDLFLIQFKDVISENFQQTYSYRGEYWVNLGSVVKGNHVLTNFDTIEDLEEMYPYGLGSDDATMDRSGWLVTVGHDIPIIIDTETGLSVDSSQAILIYDEINDTYSIELPDTSSYEDTTNLTVDLTLGYKLYGFDYRKYAWYAIQDMAAGAVKPEYSILVAPADQNNLPDDINVNQLNSNGIWLVEVE